MVEFRISWAGSCHPVPAGRIGRKSHAAGILGVLSYAIDSQAQLPALLPGDQLPLPPPQVPAVKDNSWTTCAARSAACKQHRSEQSRASWPQAGKVVTAPAHSASMTASLRH